MKPLFKKRIILNKNLHLADLLYLIDSQGRYSFKCSFKNKISPVRTWKKHYGGLEKLDFEQPHTVKKVEDGESIEISFKFKDNKIELKREIKDGSIDRSFYLVEMPITRNLFTVIIRNQESLKSIKPSNEDIIIDHPELKDQVAIVFSFEGKTEEGEMKPIMDTIVNARVGKQYLVQFPEQELRRLHIAVVKDNNPMPDSDCLIAIPHDSIKVT
ncbi:hypothetical protein IH982_02600 [Patescibacteria group bacterium]|nr:hypothetical protein [Patescibacteria group bacterium]